MNSSKKLLILFQVFQIFVLVLAKKPNKCQIANPCKNLAKCKVVEESPDDIMCICSRGFRGTLCEKWPASCKKNFCFNGGKCKMQKKVPKCECPAGFGGLFCERKVEIKHIEEEFISVENSTESYNLTEVASIELIELNDTLNYTESFNVSNTENTTEVTLLSNSTESLISNVSTTVNTTEFIPRDTTMDFEEMDLSGTSAPTTEMIVENITEPLSEEIITTTQLPVTTMRIKHSESPHLKLWTIGNKNLTVFANICMLRPCKNGAECVLINDIAFLFRCECAEGFKGKLCEEEITSTKKPATVEPKFQDTKTICDFHPCLNDGVCVSLEDNKFECRCSRYFGGILCEQHLYSQNLLKNLLSRKNPVSDKKSSTASPVSTSSFVAETEVVTTVPETETTTLIIESTETEPTTTVSIETTTLVQTEAPTTTTKSTTTTPLTTTTSISTTTFPLTTEPETTTTTEITTKTTTEMQFLTENRFSPCKSLKPCLNNGMCVDVFDEHGYENFKCYCKIEFYGVFCQHEVVMEMKKLFNFHRNTM